MARERILPYIPGKTLDEVKTWVRRVLSGKSGDKKLVKVKDLKQKPQ